MKNVFFIIVFLILIGCSVESPITPVDRSVEAIYDSPNASIEEMVRFIGYVDSSGLVEKVSTDFKELKETNEKLETTLEETKQELATTKEELVETKVTLQKTEQVVKAITGDSSSNASSFELLPIKK